MDFNPVMNVNSSFQKKPCTNWQQLGTCKFSSGCFYAHTMPTFAPATASPIACKNMLATGACKFGSRCRFEHSAPIPSHLGLPMNGLSIQGQVQPPSSAAEHPSQDASAAMELTPLHLPPYPSLPLLTWRENGFASRAWHGRDSSTTQHNVPRATIYCANRLVPQGCVTCARNASLTMTLS